MYAKPGATNPHSADLRLKSLVWTLENKIKEMEPGVEKMTWILDFTVKIQKQEKAFFDYNKYTKKKIFHLGLWKQRKVKSFTSPKKYTRNLLY